MSHDAHHPNTASGVCYEDRLPVDWEVLQQLPSEGELLRQNGNNEEMLHILMALDETRFETEEREEKEVHAGLQRVEGKLDLLIGMLGQLLLAQTPLPPVHNVVLSSSQIKLQVDSATATHPPAPGSLIHLRLFLSPRIPHPIILLADIEAHDHEWVSLSIIHTDDRVQDLWDKFIFRQHRRGVALARSKK